MKMPALRKGKGEENRTEAEIKCDVDVAYQPRSEDWLIYPEPLLILRAGEGSRKRTVV